MSAVHSTICGQETIASRFISLPMLAECVSDDVKARHKIVSLYTGSFVACGNAPSAMSGPFYLLLQANVTSSCQAKFLGFRVFTPMQLI